MLKRILRKFRPTPASSMAVALLGLIVALGSSGWAANGGNFVLGLFNSATQKTALIANYNGSALHLSNTSTGGAATPLQLTSAAGRPPMTINSTAKVANLNADYIDGLNGATQLTRVMRVPFNIADGAVSAPITVPANVPVEVIAVLTVFLGIEHHAVERLPGQAIVWRDSADTLQHSSVPGTLIMNISGGVKVEVAGPDTIRVHNISGSSVSGSVSLMW